MGGMISTPAPQPVHSSQGLSPSPTGIPEPAEHPPQDLGTYYGGGGPALSTTGWGNTHANLEVAGAGSKIGNKYISGH